jgi:glucose-1-phosphate cytidylyltransferase
VKAVILAGGTGTRINEEAESRPKPMIEIGGKPILWHILKIYSCHGVRDFIICCGYKGYLIKEYFSNYFLHMSDVTFDMSKNLMHIHERKAEPWRITLVDTGENTSTGGRLKRISKYLTGQELFCFTYGDGLTDMDITNEIEFHRSHGKLATVMAVQAQGRFGELDIKGNNVSDFVEKPNVGGHWENAGFFVLNSEVLDLIEHDTTAWEEQTLKYLADMGQLVVYPYPGFWQPIDTVRDKNGLEEMWAANRAPWKAW